MTTEADHLTAPTHTLHSIDFLIMVIVCATHTHSPHGRRPQTHPQAPSATDGTMGKRNKAHNHKSNIEEKRTFNMCVRAVWKVICQQNNDNTFFNQCEWE